MMVDGASMFLTGPGVVREAIGEDVTTHSLGGTRVHERNGVCDLVAPTIPAATEAARDLIGYLVSPFEAARPEPMGDPGNLVPAAPRKTYDVRDVIRSLADAGDFLEMAPRWARNMVTGFCRIEGRAVAVVANQPRYLGGVIDSDASEKAARFVRTCSSFGLPLVVLVDTPGFMPGMSQESAGVIRHGASLLRAFAEADVPRLTVVLRKAYGGAYITMNSKDLGAHLTFAWPQAEMGVMAARQAVGIINRRELSDAASHDELASRYAAEHLGAATAAQNGFVDEVIAPADTRARLAWGLATL
jgi:acetyl-CoA carboxylase carboxyltransferase component